MGIEKTKCQDARVTLASRADRYLLYQEAVQSIDVEMEFVGKTFRSLRDRDAHTLREDFCGTAAASCQWVRMHPKNRAVGVDIDSKVLDWARSNNIPALPAEDRFKVELIRANVMNVKNEPCDVVAAFNFSYWCFKKRAALRRYFEKVYHALKEDGVFFLDAFGGYEAYQLLEEQTEFDGFTYIWDQHAYDPLSGDYLCKIHFSFPDGSMMRNAFTYKWRLWSLPELREILEEAGFGRISVYWEGFDEKEKYLPVRRGDPDAGWIVYLVAER